MKTILIRLLPLLLLLASRCLHGQNADPLAIAHAYVHAHLDEWGLDPQDVEGMTVNDLYTDQSTGITRVFFLQRYRGIPVYNAILNLSISKTGKVFFAGNRFVSGLAGKINTTAAVLSPGEAVATLAGHLGLPAEELAFQRQNDQAPFVFDKGRMAREDITAMMTYQPYQGRVRLAWDVLLSPAGTFDEWSTRVDAVSGAILDESNWTLSCFETKSHTDGAVDDCAAPAGFIPEAEHKPALSNNIGLTGQRGQASFDTARSEAPD